MRAVPVVLGLVLAACGDNATEGTTCEMGHGELPTEGMYIDPYEIELPDCVEGGLADLPGRWFHSVPQTYFQFEYPRYEGTCSGGFHRVGSSGIDTDDTDSAKYTRYVWNDGTRYFERTRQVYGFADRTTEYIRTTVVCMQANDTVAVGYIRYDSDNGERRFVGTGTRFAQKDDLAGNMELVGELGVNTSSNEIYALNLIVDASIAYVVGTTGLHTIDVADPANPQLLGYVEGYLNDVRIVHGMGKTVAYAASEAGDDRVWIIDVTDPLMPEFVSVIDEYAHSLQVRTNGATTELYLANYSETIPRYDVTNPLNPIPMGQAVLPGETLSGVHDLTVYGNRIYANNTDAGFVAVDTTASFAAPTEIGRKLSAYSHASWAGVVNGRELVLHGDEGLSGGSDGAAFMRVLDGDPASATFMQDLGRYQSRKEVGIHNIEVHGTRAYISYYHDGVRIVDLTDPASPVEVAHYNTWDYEKRYGSAFDGAVGVRKAGDYVYVADLARGLLILREL